jgi:inhibitor of cysteine peptidase
MGRDGGRIRAVGALACLLALVLGLTTLTGCGTSAGASNLVKVTEADSGKTITLKKGDTLEVTLEGNPSTGFNWLVAAAPAALFKQRGEAEVVDPNAGGRASSTIVGAAQLMALTFDAVGSGSGKLVLEYKRSWETLPAEKTFTIEVRVN